MFNIDQIVKALQTDPNTQRTAVTRLPTCDPLRAGVAISIRTAVLYAVAVADATRAARLAR